MLHFLHLGLETARIFSTDCRVYPVPFSRVALRPLKLFGAKIASTVQHVGKLLFAPPTPSALVQRVHILAFSIDSVDETRIHWGDG